MTSKMSKLITDTPAAGGANGEVVALGGGLEGAQRTSRETMSWQPPMFVSPDSQINPVKDMADARGRDLVMNDGFMAGAVHTNRDSIVGAQYLVNAQPDLDVLQQLTATHPKAWVRKIRFTESWHEKFQAIVESKFNLIADSSSRWFDVGRRNTLTEMIRLAVATHVMTGEVLASVEWMDMPGRACKTAIQLINPTRLCNPNDESDTRNIRKGIEFNDWGQPVAFYIRNGYPLDFFNRPDEYRWKRVPAEKPWGRRQIIHIIEQMLIDQSRGISEMVSAMKEARMTKRFQEITLQSAVVNATYAAAIETELPREMVFGMMGGNQNEFGATTNGAIGDYLGGLMEYMSGAKNIQLDGAKMPVLYPGTKLNLQGLGTPGGVGTSFEESLQRHIAASLGLSYEQFSRDFSKSNYSSARASMGETHKRMNSKKKVVADAFASEVYTAWLEEDIQMHGLPVPDGCTEKEFAALFYEPLFKDAIVQCEWIGASRGQIDELKETQAAVLRITSGLSTRENESARLGQDWRKLLRQRAREVKMEQDLGLDFSSQATKPGANMAQQTLKGNDQENNSSDTNDAEDNE